MKASEIREMSNEERDVALRDLNEELFKLRFQQTSGQLDNPSKLRDIRRSIARLRTVMGEIERTKVEKAE